MATLAVAVDNKIKIHQDAAVVVNIHLESHRIHEEHSGSFGSPDLTGRNDGLIDKVDAEEV